MRSCLTPNEMAGLLTGDLDDVERLDREDHVGDCADCQQALLQFSGDATLVIYRAHRDRPHLPEPPTDFLRQLKQVAVGPAPSPWPTVPGYTLLGELGHGGMAVVYRATQLGLNRPVALKMILAGRHARASDRERFRSEAAAVARLRHPHIVQVYETGEHDGLPYFSMELMDGGTLAQAHSRERRARNYGRAAAIVETLARAIHYAHEQGVIHRDLKPANVLLATAGSFEELKIADFGLALFEDGRSAQTGTGAVMGTPSYMAPEQAQSRRGDVGPATDIHALGAILYELVTGRPPFDGATAVETLLQVSFEEPLPPRRLRPDMPRDLETICLKCLRKLPQQRYATALDLANDLRHFREGKPIRARPITPLERAVKWARRQPVVASLLAGIVAVTVLAFVGISFALWNTRLAQQNEAEQRRAAERALDRSERSVYLGNIAQARSQWLLNNVRASATLLEQCQPGRRGWEWHYLNGLNHTDLLTIPDTGGPVVTGLTYGPAGRWLAVGGGSPFGSGHGVVQVFDAETGRRLWQRDDLRYFVRGVACSPDGRLVASAGGNWHPSLPGELKVWDAGTGKLLHDLGGHTKEVIGVAFSPDGQKLASASGDGTVRVWDVTGGRELQRLEHTTGALRVAFSPDTRLLITGGGDGVRVWEAGTGKPLAFFPRVGSVVALSPDGKQLATDHPGGARVWNLLGTAPGEEPRLELAHSFTGHGGPVSGLAFSPDGAMLATASADGTLRTWDLSSGQQRATYRGHEGRVNALAFHPNGRAVATGGEQPGDVKVWDLTRPVEYTVAVCFGGERRDVAALCFTADDRELLVLGAGGALRRWDCASGLVVKEQVLPCSNEWMVPSTLAAFSGDGRVLAAVSASDPAEVAVVDPVSGRLWATLRGHTLKVRHVACDRDGTRVATAAFGSRDGRFVRELRVWEARTGRVVREEAALDEHCDGLALSPDGEWLAEARRALEIAPDGGVKAGPSIVLVSDARAGTPRTPPPDGVVRALAFSTDGSHLAAVCESGEVQVWDRDGQPLHERPMQGPPGLSAVAFSPDGSRLAAVSRERAQVWDVASGQQVLFLRGAEPRPRDNAFNPVIAWSPDGSRLAASNWSRDVSVWETGRRAAGRAVRWHRDRAEGAAQAGATFAYSFHRDQLAALTPATDVLRRERADFFARRGAWDQARADLAATFAGGPPEQASGWLNYAVVLLQTGQRAEYERVRAQVLERFGDSDDPAVTRRLAGASGLSPMSEAEARRYLRVARKHGESEPGSRLASDYLGLALYRANRWDEAERCLGRSDGTALTWAALALVQLRQERAEQAKASLAKVDAWLAAQPKGGTELPEGEWETYLAVRALRREAGSLTGGARDAIPITPASPAARHR